MLIPMQGSGSTNSHCQKGMFHVKQREFTSSWAVGSSQQPNIIEWNAGVDAITVVGQDHHSALLFYNEYENVKTRLDQQEKQDKPWGMHGYRGKQCGSVRVGLKDDKTILMVTGPQAERVFAVSRTVAVKYTRIDLQVTLKLETPVRMWAYNHYHSDNLTSVRERGKMYMSLINSPTGDTLYLNKRTSPTFGRMYDKSREYEEVLGKVWRFEVEAKEEHCDKLGRILEYLGEYEDVAADYVAGWYSDREVCVPVGIRDGISLPKLAEKITSNAQKLEWLRRQVAPSIQELIQVGLREDVEKALGVKLDEIAYLQERIDF